MKPRWGKSSHSLYRSRIERGGTQIKWQIKRMSADQTWKDWGVQWFFVLPLFAVLLVVCIPLMLIGIIIPFLLRLIVLFMVWGTWSPRGFSMLIVYSNSPHWQDYFEKGLLPLVGRRAKVLNWSERKTWSLRLIFGISVFGLFKGEKEYNPMILFFRPFHWPKRLRFYRPFHDGRHGKYGPLCDLENELADWLNQPIDLIQFHPRKSVSSA